jgi:glutathione peroxidase
MKICNLLLPIFFLGATAVPVASAVDAPLFKIPLTDIDGNAGDLSEWSNYVILVVNVASECGYTSQYEGLEKLYKRYKDRGFTVIGFPCNDFGEQEPASEKRIKAFCSSNFSVTFPLMSKVRIRANAHPLFAALTDFKSPFPGPVHWNFNKFLIGRDGVLRARFESDVEPDSIQLKQAIEKALEVQKR